MKAPITPCARRLFVIACLLLATLSALAALSPLSAAGVEPLTRDGNHFKTGDGAPVRFWGVNLVASYPTHAQAEQIAANLAERQVNVVRPHHNMRSSLDWNTISGIPALVTYAGNSRTPHVEAWDRFDYLNAQLREQGIYLMLSLHSTRRFLPGDVDIMATDDTDRTAWMNAMSALGSMPSNLDLFKMLPMIDERCAKLMEEFAERLVTHVNPYTGLAYGSDPQVLYIEMMNEHSAEYAIVAGNKFQNTTYPAVSYWTTVLQSKWDAYTAAHGLAACDIYAPPTTEQRLARGDFLRGLDEAYFNRMKAFVRGLGCETPLGFSNLWRGEAFQKLEESLSDVVEEHNYPDPLVARSFDDAFSYFARSTPVEKPYFVGELNQSLSDSAINANSPFRTMLPLAASAYGTFNDWSGVTLFAWAHGDKMVGNDGWSIWEERRPAVNSDIIGQIESDGMMLDHLRTTGMIFRRGLVAPSASPVTWYADDPLGATNYSSLMAPKYPFKAGWQSIHAIKRAFGPVPPSQPTAEWMTTSPANPLVADTGEITKDTTRQQLTVHAAQAEAFSGKLDSQAPAGLTHLGVGSTSGSATVILVSDDSLPLATSENFVISRTYLDGTNAEVANPVTTLSQLKAASDGFVWHIKRTRPRGETGYEALTMTNGTLTLPSDGWHEAELKYAAAGSLPPRESLTQVGDVLRPVFDDAYRIAGVLGTAQGGFTLNAQQVIDPSTTFTPAEGAKSVRMKFTAGLNPCVLGIHFTNSINQAAKLDLTSMRNTSGLRFWVYTKRVVSSFSIELACDNGGKVVEARLPLSNYLQPSDYGNKWVEVTVPFADFPDTGINYDATTGQTTPMPFVWTQVKGVGFYCSTVTDGYYDPYFDHLRIVRATPAAPVITSALSATGTFGEAFSYTITASNGPTSFSAAGLPAGLACEAQTGVISGTPVAAGEFAVTLSATNAGGAGTATLALTIARAAATIELGSLNQVYDGSAKSATATTTPAGLAVDFTYNDSSAPPVNAGSYAVVATIADPNYTGSASGMLTIAKAPATVTLGNLQQTYDGSPKTIIASTNPAGLAASIAYDGSSTAPTHAGSYAVFASVIDPNYTGSASGTLTIAKATATILLENLRQSYDGTAKTVVATTSPTDLTVDVLYEGGASAPIYPGTYAVSATINDRDYTGSASGSLLVTVTALLRHAPTLDGDIEGSAQILLPENVTLNSGALVSHDVLVPGTPALVSNGSPTLGGVIDGPGETTPTTHSITLNHGSVLRYLVRRIDPIGMPVVAAPPAPTGARSVALSGSGGSIGSFATLRNLTLNGNVGSVAVPPGTYGNFTANSGSGFVLGVPGAAEPAVYNLQNLTLNSGSTLEIAGPVVLTIANGVAFNAAVGNAANPAWLTLQIYSGGVALNSGVSLYGRVVAPTGAVTLGYGSALYGEVTADRLSLNGGLLIER